MSLLAILLSALLLGALVLGLLLMAAGVLFVGSSFVAGYFGKSRAGAPRSSSEGAAEAPDAGAPTPAALRYQSAWFWIRVGGMLALLAGVVFAGFPLYFWYEAIIRPERREKKENADELAIREDLRRLGAAETAYQSANGGFFDTPSCLAQPRRCIPGYLGPSFVDKELASLGTRSGYRLVFSAGPAAPRQARATGKISASSALTFAVLARYKDNPRRVWCVDARRRVCYVLYFKWEDAKDGVCQCVVEGAGARVEPLALAFTHVEGKSPCPQAVGTIHVYNDSARDITTDVRYVLSPSGRVIRSGVRDQAGAPLSFEASKWDWCQGVGVTCNRDRSVPVAAWSNMTVPARSRESLAVFYTCAGKEDFSVEINVLQPQDTTRDGEFESKFTVYGTILR